MSGKTLDLSQLTKEELQEALKLKQAEEQRELRDKRIKYETDRENMINSLCTGADSLSKMIEAFKTASVEKVTGFKEQLLEYGDIRKGEQNKGSFEVKNDRFKILVASQVKHEFDERADLAETKLKKFLESFIKKRDLKMYKLIMGLLERNSVTGKLDISNISRLYKLEDEFDNQDWKDAIRLFKEAYVANGTASYIRFYEKDATGKFQLINLNFSSI